MPIYEYICKSCKFEFEVLQKISDDTLKICPNCNQNSVVKLISNTNFKLKGTGWYVTDFAKKNYKTTQSSDEIQVSTNKKNTTNTSKQ